MIIGLGTDIIEIERIRTLHKKTGEAFLKRILTEDEISTLPNQQNNPSHFYGYIAKRFAAKEAFSKALGTGIGETCSFLDIYVTNDAKGKPAVSLSEKVTTYICSQYGHHQVDISLSDTENYATSTVIISTSTS